MSSTAITFLLMLNLLASLLESRHTTHKYNAERLSPALIETLLDRCCSVEEGSHRGCCRRVLQDGSPLTCRPDDYEFPAEDSPLFGQLWMSSNTTADVLECMQRTIYGDDSLYELHPKDSSCCLVFWYTIAEPDPELATDMAVCERIVKMPTLSSQHKTVLLMRMIENRPGLKQCWKDCQRHRHAGRRVDESTYCAFCSKRQQAINGDPSLYDYEVFRDDCDRAPLAATNNRF